MAVIEKEALLEKVQSLLDQPTFMHDGDDWEGVVTAVETLIEYAPVKEAVPIDFMREYIQREGMSIHDISVISQMYEAYKANVECLINTI